MSGLGRKVFTSGEVLSAADVNGYLMDQSVLVFSNEADRTTEVPAPTAGMVSYRLDSTLLEIYNGSAWVSANSLGGTVTGSQVIGSITTATIPAASVVNTLTSLAGTTHSFAAGEQGQVLRFTAAGTVTATIGTATALTAGQRIDILADGAAGVRVITGAGVTLAGAGEAGTAYLIAQYDAATVMSVGSDTYRIIGNITAV
jgi:hypothetical protein